MVYRDERKEKKIWIKRKKAFKRYEKHIFSERYRGKENKRCKRSAAEAQLMLTSSGEAGGSDAVSVRHSVALTRLLAHESGCAVLRAQKELGTNDRVSVRKTYEDQIKENGTHMIIELRVHRFEDNVVRIGTYGIPEDGSSTFGVRLARYIFEYEYRDEETPECIVGTCEPDQSTVLYEVASELKLPVLIIDINRNRCDISDMDSFETTYGALKKIIAMLQSLDWDAAGYDVYRVWQAHAKSQIPQDKIELGNIDGSLFSENAFLHICSFEGVHETVRLNKMNANTQKELSVYLSEHHQAGSVDEYVILTNRLIENLFGREWFEGREELPGLRGIPVIVYENNSESYEIGIPKANQVKNIALSTALYEEKLPTESKYEYYIFNRYADSRIYIDIGKSDYQDHGRVKEKDGTPYAKKVMLPRYYRLMMGFLEKPLKTIRAEEYRKLVSGLPEGNGTAADDSAGLPEGNGTAADDSAGLPEKNGTVVNDGGGQSEEEITREDFERCYKKMPGQAYYQLVEEEASWRDEDKVLYEKSVQKVIRYLERSGVYSHVDLIRIPKRMALEKKLYERILGLADSVRMRVLKMSIGKAEYMLKTKWADGTDDKNSVARLNSNMMSLLGVTENDKIRIRFGDNVITLRVLPSDTLTDYEVGIPASGRRELGMNSINDIVVVHRDMLHTFRRHSQEQTIAILGTVLAVAQVLMAFDFFTGSWVGIILAVVLCVIAIVLMLYFALSEERIKVK